MGLVGGVLGGVHGTGLAGAARRGGIGRQRAHRRAVIGGANYAVLTGGLPAQNLDDRTNGFKSKLGDKFTEASGSPCSYNDDASTGVQFIQDTLAKHWPGRPGHLQHPETKPQGYAEAEA